MKLLIALAVVVACARADVSHILASSAEAPIIKSSYDISPDGNFNYIYETGNGISSQAQGVVKNPNSDEPTLEITGSWKFIAPDGSPVEFSYIANENGYQPQGNLIPQSPPIPEAIARSLEYIATHPQVAAPVYQAQPQQNNPFRRF